MKNNMFVQLEDKRYWKRVWVRRLVKFKNPEDMFNISGYDKEFNDMLKQKIANTDAGNKKDEEEGKK